MEFSILAVVFSGLFGSVSAAGGGGGGGGGPPPYSTELESQLRSELFTGYEVLQRPSKKVNVILNLTLLTVNELNIKEQMLSVTCYLSMTWRDRRLSWVAPSSGNDYSSIKFLFSTEEYVWRPSLVAENSIDDISIISDVQTPMRIIQMGMVTWNPLGIYKVSCESDITYYPLDMQQCYIKVTAWAYTTSEIKLRTGSDTINTDFYSENGEWVLEETTTGVDNDKSRGGASFSSVTFSMKFRRRLLFHVLTTLFPVSLMAILIPMVFKLHPDSGEKIGFSLTVLLAYAVYLTVISDNIPSTSVTACYLSIYLVLVLAIATFSVLCTLIVLDFNFRTAEQKMNPITEAILFELTASIVCHKLRKCACVKRQKNQVEILKLEETKDNFKRKELETEVVMNETRTWQEAAEVLDKLFFLIFMFFVIFVSLGYYCLILGNYV